VFVVDIGHEKNAIAESKKLGLPIIGIVDTNHNPEGIDYVVPGNDDSIRAIGYYAREIANAVLEAKAAAGTQIKKKAPAKKAEAPVATETKAAAKVEAPVVEAKPAAEKKAPAKKAEAPVEAKVEAPVEAEASLNGMLKAELVALAKEKGIEIASKDTKADIIAKLA